MTVGTAGTCSHLQLWKKGSCLSIQRSCGPRGWEWNSLFFFSVLLLGFRHEFIWGKYIAEQGKSSPRFVTKGPKRGALRGTKVPGRAQSSEKWPNKVVNEFLCSAQSYTRMDLILHNVPKTLRTVVSDRLSFKPRNGHRCCIQGTDCKTVQRHQK